MLCMEQYETGGAWIVPKLIKRYLLWTFWMTIWLTMLLFPQNVFLHFLTEKVPTFWFYMAILHVIHKSINCGSKYANLTQNLFQSSLKVFATTVFLFYEKKKQNAKILQSAKFGSFLSKNTFFGLFFFWPPSFFGRKQTNSQKNFVGHPK